MRPDPDSLRERLDRSRLLLLFTPDVCGGDPLRVLETVLAEVDIVQVRPKASGAHTPCDAKATFDWTVAVLDLVHARANHDVLVMVDDRVDVARALWDRGCAGVHVGADDMPAHAAREFLGDGPLIGLSTHSLEDVIAAEEMPVDYLGFGPVRPTGTKGYERGLGTEMAWVAAAASARPLFPIGGIDAQAAAELARVGRAAVASAILSAADPVRAARELRLVLETEAD